MDLFRKFFDLTLRQGRWNAWVSWREDRIQLVVVGDNISVGGVDQKVWMLKVVSYGKGRSAGSVIFDIAIHSAVAIRRSVVTQRGKWLLEFGFQLTKD